MKMMNEQFFAPGLQEAMRVQGRTMAWLARQVGVDAPLLTHATRRRRTVSLEVAEKISMLIGVPFSALFESPHGATTSANDSTKETVAA